MENFKKLRPLKKASVILLAVFAFIILFMVFTRTGNFIYFVVNSLFIAGAVTIAYGILFSQKHESYILYGFLAFAVGEFLTFVTSLFTKAFYVYEYSYYYYEYEQTYSFSFFALLLGLLSLAGFIFMLAFAYINYDKKLTALDKFENKINKFFEKVWFLPFSLLAFVEVVVIFWNIFGYSKWYAGMQYSSLQRGLLIAVFVLMTLIWKYKDGIPKNENTKKPLITTGGKLSLRAYCGIVQFILLSFFTFGIWTMIWVYRMTKELNCVDGFEYRNPVKKLLLYIFIPFYSIYWFYQTAIRTDKLSKNEEIWSDISMLTLVFALCFPLGSALLIQGKVNEIVLKYNK